MRECRPVCPRQPLAKPTPAVGGMPFHVRHLISANARLPRTALLASLLLAAGCDGLGGATDDGPALLWRAPLQADMDPWGTPATDGQRLYAVVGGVAAFDLGDGRLLWRTPLDTYKPRNVETDGQRVYAAERRVHALDAATGQPLWQFEPDENASLGRSLVHDGVLYFGTSSHRVYALDAATGRQLWQTDMGLAFEHPSVVRGVAASGDTLYASLEQWRAHNGYISSGWLVAMDAATGEVLWRYRSGEGDERHGFGSRPVVAGRLLLASDVFSNAVVTVDRFTGEEVWRFQGTRGYVGFHEGPVVRGGTAYAGSGDMHAYALNLATGERRWRTQPEQSAITSFVLCGEWLLVNYLGLAALEASTGRPIGTLLEGDTREFVITDFALAGERAFVLGNRFAYAVDCTR